MKLRLPYALLLTASVTACLIPTLARSEPPHSASDDYRSVRMELKIGSGSHPGAYEVGESIPYEVRIRNEGDKPVRIDLLDPDFFPPQNYWIVVKDHDGKALPARFSCEAYSIISGRGPVAPGESTTGTGWLNQFVTLSTPGVYTVNARSNSFVRNCPDSPPVELTIKPATPAGRKARLRDATNALLSAQSANGKMKAVLVLGFTLDPAAIPMLVKAMREPGLRSAPQSGLCGLSERDLVQEAMLDELKTYGPYEPLAYMLSWIQVPEKESVPLLGKWLRKGNPAQLSSALHALWMNSREYVDPSLKRLIRACLKNPNPDVRRNAVLALRVGKYGGTLVDAMRVAETDPNAGVRVQAIYTLGYKDRRVVALLEKLAHDESFQIAQAAQDVLSRKAH